MGALLVAGLALGLADGGRSRGGDWTTGSRAGGVILSLVAALAMALSGLASLSRGGGAALAAGAACFVALVAWRRRGGRAGLAPSPRAGGGARPRPRRAGAGRGARSAPQPERRLLPDRHLARLAAPRGGEPGPGPRSRGLPRRVPALQARSRDRARRALRERLRRDAGRDRHARPRRSPFSASSCSWPPPGGGSPPGATPRSGGSPPERWRHSPRSPSTRRWTSTCASPRTPRSPRSRRRRRPGRPGCAPALSRGRRRSLSPPPRSGSWRRVARLPETPWLAARAEVVGVESSASADVRRLRLERAEAALSRLLRTRPAHAESWLHARRRPRGPGRRGGGGRARSPRARGSTPGGPALVEAARAARGEGARLALTPSTGVG